MPTSHQIRQQFVDYFVKRHDHVVVPSSPVVPHDDPTLLFANAGMNQFKDVFLGLAGSSSAGPGGYKRVVNSQKCIRAGGKHNDLEDVGKDHYHHTFFEMLGNWSFGDYFKAEAIAWAWKLLTEVWGLPKDRLYATFFAGDPGDGVDPDTESRKLWTQVTDIDPSHVTGWDKKDNFWEMGPTGPCGPCSEVHIDLSPDGRGGDRVNRDDPQVIELWNLVFIQFSRDASGSLTPLPARHVDTGLGLERIARVIQKVDSNYDTDLFTPILAAIGQVTGAAAYGGSLSEPVDIGYRVIADHIRSLTFALSDGAVPDNEGRGYVLRRILRRAVRYGWQVMHVHEPFLYRLVDPVVELMGAAFAELRRNRQRVIDLILDEEKTFGRTLERGFALFEQAATRSDAQIDCQDAFKLHDTYGFPLDLTQLMAAERSLGVDQAGFDRLMDEARQRARSGVTDPSQIEALLKIVQRDHPPATQFTGYESTELDCSTGCLLWILESDSARRVQAAGTGDRIALVSGRSPFYAQAGGQVADTGSIHHHNGAVVRVADTRQVGQVRFHIGVVEHGTFSASAEGDQRLRFQVDAPRRGQIMANHTSTHLLNRALRVHVNRHADQRGSLVDHDRLRFDFAHQAAVTGEQIQQVQETVNRDIAANLVVHAGQAPLEAGRKIHGLRAVFGEKYPPQVRIVSIGVPVTELLADPTNDHWGDSSIEFCGGTHLPRTGLAEVLVIVAEEAVAKGVRRITALTAAAARQAEAQGQALLEQLEALTASDGQALDQPLRQLGKDLEAAPVPLADRHQLQARMAELLKAVKGRRRQEDRQASGDIVTRARQVAEACSGTLIVASVGSADARLLRTAMDVIRKKRPEAAMLLGSVSAGRVAFVAAVPESLIAQGLKAGDWVKQAAQVAGGGGGGRAGMAQAGGTDPDKLDEALSAGQTYATSVLEG